MADCAQPEQTLNCSLWHEFECLTEWIHLNIFAAFFEEKQLLQYCLPLKTNAATTFKKE